MLLHNLEYFKVVAEVQNYTKAAHILSISQPALSRAIANLEEDMGVKLFEKRGRGVELNIYGKILLEHLNVAFDEINLAEKQISTLVSPVKGNIRIAFTYTLGVSFVPYLIRDFNKKNPQVTFTMSQHPARIILEMLKNGDIDLCFCPDFSDLNYTDIFGKTVILVEDFHILVNKNHPLASKTEVNLKELKDEKFISYNSDTFFKKPMLNFFEKAGYMPNIAYEANEGSTIASFVSAGLGIAIIPQSININYNKTVPLKITYPVCQRTLCMAWRKNSSLTPIANKFKEFVIKWLPENKNYNFYI